MGWAGWLSSRTEATGDAAALLGLGAAYLEDATSWELSFFARTLKAVEGRCPRDSMLLYHYTDVGSAEAIIKGRRGIRVSRGGYRGGGVFFSRLGPLAGIDAGSSQLWREVFPEFRVQQLLRNYGSDISGRDEKADAVLLCSVQASLASTSELSLQSSQSTSSSELSELSQLSALRLRTSQTAPTPPSSP
jgi:hypothetical protein